VLYAGGGSLILKLEFAFGGLSEIGPVAGFGDGSRRL
jgi:hypothetical protein